MAQETDNGDVARGARWSDELEAPEGAGGRGDLPEAPTRRAEAIGIGRNVRVPKAQVEEAVIGFVRSSLSDRGLDVPRLPWMRDHARVYFLEDGSAVVTWED